MREYLKDIHQESGKIFIKNGNNNIIFNITNNQFLDFFGNLYYDNVE